MENLQNLDPESEFLASKRQTGNEWELFKENVRPLKRGRNVRLLNDALKSYADCHLKKSLLENRRKLIEAIDQYQGEDPLQPWLECIKWVQEAFPPGGDCSGLVVIYEQCVRTFWNEDRYKEDLRYLKVWLEYAENCVDAEIIYSFLDANKIGQTHSIFYTAYALHLESKNKIKTANEIFNLGISMDAQPKDKLTTAFKKFLTRSMTRPKLTDEHLAESVPVRSFGTVLARGNPMKEKCDLERNKFKQDRTHGTSLAIYKDSNTVKKSEISKSDFQPWNILGARAERNKENNAIPSKWTNNKIPQKFVHRNEGAATNPCIEVFVDEDCAEAHKNGGKSSSLRLRHVDGKDLKKETELLRENPLRNFPSSCLPR